MKKWLLLAALLLFPLTAVSFATAASCGGSTACRCGDTVVSDYRMPADLFCSNGHGLKLANWVTLDCANHNLYGEGGKTDTYGLYFDGTWFATAKNCGAFYFERGIRFNGANYNLVQDTVTGVNGNTSTHVGYGIDFAGQSSANVLLRVISMGNADEGIHIGTSANYNHVNAVYTCGNFRESLYILDAGFNDVIGSDIGADCYGYSSGSTAFYMKNGASNLFEWNQFRKGSAHVTGNSYKNIFIFNDYSQGLGYKEDCYAPTGQCPSLTITVK